MWSDIISGDDGGIGPQSDGTYDVPMEAAPNNRPWDSGGGVLGGYGSDIMDILKQGVGAAARSYDTRQLLDYKRFEATQGGAFQQGVPTRYNVSPGMGAGLVISPLMILLAVGAFVLLKK